MSAVLKADFKRVKAKHAARYTTKLVDEQRMTAGVMSTVQVRTQPDALPLEPRKRHELATGKR